MTPFELAEPTTLSEAIGLLDPDDPTIRPISGGTALMLMMKAGVFHPSRLVSLRGIEPRFSEISLSPEGGLDVGSLVRLSALERSADAMSSFPVLADTLRVLSNRRVRNVATIGGNLAHGDPHMDLPPVLMALDAAITAHGPGGERRIPMADLFLGYYETSLAPDELIGRLHIPAQGNRVSAYIKCTTRSADDWPALGVAVSLDLDGDTIRDARIVVSAATERPTRMTEAEAAVRGAAIGDALFREAGERAAGEAEVMSDTRGSAPYKQQLVRVFTGRALAKAVATTGRGPIQ
ncbi:carbon-monoxide dehydrogenase medium subunit [Rhodoligotrophos appendicifer]|uniref:FAD binding domain-containing protein n=1 Tax=Rhodoligotrophos appendicifer TaxID=987056 RepID=UPI0011816FAB|nr:xanthine dehydrogenase family protein subunit M [Rhodoligotrophos appendicifer]